MRFAVFSDIHANLVALEAVIRAAGTIDGVWHLGDVVGYGPDPNGTVERLRSIGAIGVLGNHDAAAIGGAEIEWFNPDARRAMEWTRTAINETTLTWLAALPVTAVLGDITLVHGSPRDPTWEYVTSVPVARTNLSVLGTRIGLHGHTHMAAAWLEEDGSIDALSPGDQSVLELRGRRVLANPGSVGQPRDGNPAASFMILDTSADTITWHRATYDIAAVQDAMRAEGLPSNLIARLAVGH